jgi:hypothetical protein
MVTVRQWQPLVSFVLYWRDAALTAIEHFERAQKHALGLHTFGRLGAVSDPAYLEGLLEVMQAEHPTLSRVGSTIAAAAKTQWYAWHVNCPDLPVHAERRMFLSFAAVVHYRNYARVVVVMLSLRAS